MAEWMYAERPVNSLLSSYGAFPGGSNPQRKECKAAINYDTPFSSYPWRSGLVAGGMGDGIFTFGVYRVTGSGVTIPRRAGCAGPGIAEMELLEFFLPRSAHVCNKPRIGSLVVFVVATSVAQAEIAVDCSANHICIPVILPVILPPAHLA